MSEYKSTLLFNLIAPVYGLFYKSQKKNYTELINKYNKQLKLSSYKTVLDVGCGTGSLCSALNENGFEVTGVDVATRMLDIAALKNKDTEIKFLESDVLIGLPFEKNSFDIVFASYVLHGLKQKERMKIYEEMNRIAKDMVIIHDYSKNRKLLTSIIEFFEGGDYFNFIKTAENEMLQIFKKIEVIKISEMANWYICYHR